MVAQKAKVLGCRVIACDLYENEMLKNEFEVTYSDMAEVFRQSDIVSIHMKSTDENNGIINKNLFRLMKKDALFVNVARAELVNNDDLYDALKTCKIAGAAIDVYDSEPPSELDYRLAQLDNVIATPHIAYNTQNANDNSIQMSVHSILENL